MPPSKPYPAPLVIPPLKNDQHTHTIILLHGRGSNGERFGHVFIATGIAKRLPTTKFIFPTARKRRSTVLKRIPINQWFDNYSLEDPNTRTELQIDGLQESSELLRRLVDEEAKLLSNDPAFGDGYSRVVIGGLSQGWEIAGLLQIDKGDQGESESEAEEDDDDPFARDTDGDDVPAHIQAVNHIRDILGMPPFQSEVDGSENALRVPYLETPVFLGHGSADPKVSVDLGRRMASILSDGFGMDVTWKAYEEFGHWYKVPDEIDDVLRFLEEKAGFPVFENVE
ncbi:hypothetical protein CNMCM5793_000066 [Aspergillus hiratsukae]|uniref:Phospholipase/carboxylesterase/thioesterase domain-containing protein n=1 Tax=Aspergillus hiratsukae TaxID=1194566 RepID=A0A8H6P946_9EURO|nr:hypothetical protein CNMCM5793_000066 [Aspergillus hiratsukae]KAF7160880.1 hypothetical protein CNMCM6106_008254 [Aspergillus hiratsukae]